MSAMGLTRQQYSALTFMNDRIKESGVAPSFDEIKDAINIKSKSGVFRVITALEERGFIRRMERRARAIEIVKLPGNMQDSQRPAISRDQHRHGRTPAVRSPIALDGSVAVPLVGRIGAVGTPIEALQNKIADVQVGSGMLGRGNHYALEVTGDSMMGAGIIDGDIVVIQGSDAANSGEIVVVLVDGEVAYLRRYRRRGDCAALEACNFAYETRLYSPGRVAVQGRLVGLVRRY